MAASRTTMTYLSRLWSDTSGQDLAEYAIAFGIVTLAVIAAAVTFGGNVVAALERAANAISAL